jgi:hypothetical protein
MAKRRTTSKTPRKPRKPRKAKRPADATVLVRADVNSRSGYSGEQDPVIKAMIAQCQENEIFDGRLYSSTDTRARRIFLPVPALAPRFLMHLEGWPLGRFILISGLPESYKSTFMAEIGRWHRLCGGNFALIECEKDSDAAEQYDALFDYDPHGWFLTQAESQETWHRQFIFWFDTFRAIMDGGTVVIEDPVTKKKVTRKLTANGRKFPSLIGIDPMSSALLREIFEEIREEGTPKQHHMQHAKQLSDWFKGAPKLLLGFPISFAAVSHLREGVDPRQPFIKTRTTTGGAAPRFHMSMEIELRRRKAGHFSRVHATYGEIFLTEVELTTRKNSLAPHESITAEVCWYNDPADPDPLTRSPRRHTFWDWSAASIEVILRCSSGSDDSRGFSAGRARSLRELVDISKDDNRRLVWSDALGISHDDRMSYSQAGQILETKITTDESFRRDLYNLLDIQRCRLFAIGVDYQTQIDTYRKELLEALSKQVQNGVPLPPEEEEEIPT